MCAENLTSVARNLEALRERIQRAAETAGRSAEEINLIAVSKFAMAEKIIEAYECGQRLFGESRIQECREKIESLRLKIPEAKWILIGHLQSNKVGKAAELFDQVQSIDSFKVVSKLNEQVRQSGSVLEVLLEVNSSGESQKYGVSFEEVTQLAEQIAELDSIKLAGLMTIGPHTDNEATIRKAFAKTKEIYDSLGSFFENSELTGTRGQLSMGMSSDFELAIAEGASEIRIGTAIFGPREYS
jgi:PLP dependent protein